LTLVDANILVYAHDASSRFHDPSRRWLVDQLDGPGRVGIPWQSIVAFLRLTTSPRVAINPLDPATAWRYAESWFASPVAWTPVPTERHGEILGRYVAELNLTANLVSDAHLAALAVEHGLELCSNDSDFARFPGLRWRNPLAPT
jgi:toxin-antitoxin system PIN domain toxin